MVPISKVEIIDNWHVAGMRSTGSKRIRITDALVPPHMQLTGEEMASGKKYRAAHFIPSRYYRLPTFSWMGYVIAHESRRLRSGNVSTLLSSGLKNVAN